MDINFLAVIFAALAAFFLGFIWYTVIFAKPWQAELGMKTDGDKVKTPNIGVLLIGSLILEVCMAVAMCMLITSAADWVMGLKTGFLVGFGFVAMAFGVNYLFEGKSFRFWLINAGYNILVFTIMGLVIGAM